MAKMIRISDKVYTELQQYADNNGRSISNAGEFIIHGYILGKWTPDDVGVPSKTPPSPKNTEVETLEPAINGLIKRTRRDVLAEIAQVDNELKSTVNQDPDYWADMQERKQLLWDEYNGMEDV